MQRLVLFLLAVLSFTTAHAWPGSGSVSGTELAHAILGQQADGQPLPLPTAQIERSRAQGYVMGVADSQAMHTRCDASQVLPHEQLARVHEHLQSLTPEQRQGPAAPLVAAALAC